MTDTDPLLAPIDEADHQMFGGARVDVVVVGAARVKRIIYPPGLRWSTDMKPLVGTDLCMHGHVGFLAQGALTIEFPDGCTVDYAAPAVIAVEPGHDAVITSDVPAVLIQFDFERDTNDRLGLPSGHTH